MHADADMQFECIENDLVQTQVEIVDADDHVDVVERSMRSVKEHIRTLVQGLPFRRITKFMAKRLVAVAIRNLNSFPSDNGTSSECSPLSIMTNAPSLDAAHVR